MAVALTGARTLDATREAVWAALNDVDCLRLCVPGCQDLQPGPGRSFRLKVRVRLGPVWVAFSGGVEVTESDYPRSFVMSGQGEGGLAGFANGRARIRLAEVPGGCRLVYSVQTAEDGPLASLGALFLYGIAKSLSERFVSTLADVVCEGKASESGPGERRLMS
jgi:carbon monoxide dehydrogenase subunit G